jgi:peptide subunit release factor 1 (eRF1)
VTSETITENIDDHLERLIAFEPVTLPVLSVYLNAAVDNHGRTPDFTSYLTREFKALARTWAPGSAERASFDRDTERILEYAASNIASQANGVAIFACAGADEFFEAIQLNAPLEENRIYVYNQPHLYHLARLDDEYPRYAALVTDANSARIYVFGLGQTIETEQVKGKKVHRVKVGGWSQARYQRRVGNAHQQHAKEVAGTLERIVRQENVGSVIIAGESEILPIIRDQLPKQLQEQIADCMKFDTKASEQEIFNATLEKMRQEDAATDSRKVDELFQRYRAHGLAVLGPEDTLEALANGQVDELLISACLESERPEMEEIEAILAPELPGSSGGTESEEPRKAFLPDLLVTKAKQTDAKICFVEDPELLKSIDGVGAFLRWRN